ncbi:hypothetical protein GHT06_014176 [Daphnia sinensis]|uniref:CxC3 like cysteine cluster domain-containing protein n=1 Tax=Daphnia sinensis TaxID=1820382 RepID=A0AAD5KT57_9CRUS|nr:hypothetical protein GHT06_014176 [Daphnia sinensis]
MYNEDTYRILKPEEFISCGDVVTRDIPVPCFSASFDCKKCKCLTAYTVTAGKKRVVIITKDGRFDLHFPQFNCVECGEQQFANEADFVVSGWWPSLAKIGSYFVSTSLLEMWRHLKHQTPGTSERKFVQTLSEISKIQEEIIQVKQEMGQFYNGLAEKKDAILDEIKRCSAAEKSFDKGKASLLRKELARIDSLLEDVSS